MTLHRWLKHDARFQAAYNAWQHDAITGARTKVLAMAESAASTVGAAVKYDPRIALSVLKAIGGLDRPTPGSTDPDEVQRHMKLDRAKAKSKLNDELLLSSLGSFSNSPSASELIAALEENDEDEPENKPARRTRRVKARVK
jgi:hypothetical protein